MRFALRLVVALVVSMFVLGPTVGCEKKTTTVQQSETRHESEPRMVSPGQEVVE